MGSGAVVVLMRRQLLGRPFIRSSATNTEDAPAAMTARKSSMRDRWDFFGRALRLVTVMTTASILFAMAPLPMAQAVSYDRGRATTWAHGRVLDDPDPVKFDNNCTWFVSKALWSGGLPQSDDWKASSSDLSKVASKRPGFYPGPTKAAASADYLKNYLVDAGLATIRELSWTENEPAEAQLGDVIGYDWDGGADGKLDHVMMITGFSGGYPLVSGQSNPTIDAGWTWSNTYDGWIAEVPQYRNGSNGPRAYLLHVRT